MAKFTPPPNLEIDNAVLARMQKDLDGYLDTYRNIVEKRQIKYAAEIAPMWKRISQNITKELKAVYTTAQDANGVPITKLPIQAAKYRNMQRKIEQLATSQRRLMAMLRTNDQDVKLGRNLAYEYSHAYYYNAFGLEQAAEVAVFVPALTESNVMGILANPWLPDGATYSDRIRSSAVYLAGKMEQTMVEAVGNGWDWNRTARRIQAVAQEGYYNSVRLARTEFNRAAGQGASNLYMQNADILDGKRWNATLDSRTAPKDSANDGKQYLLEYDTPEAKGNPGERIPNHPNCRCSWTPILSALGVSTKERIARGKGDSTDNFGERIYTKARTYEEYAKERGLPSLSDRLANDKPSSYLRRGEKLSDIGAPVGINPGGVAAAASVVAPIVPVFAKTWVEKFNESLPKGGLKTEAQARELGAQVREQITNALGPEVAAAEAELERLDKLRRKLHAEMLAEHKAGRDYKPKMLERDIAKELHTNIKLDKDNLKGVFEGKDRKVIVRDILAKLRPMGTRNGMIKQPWAKRSNRKAKAAVEEVLNYLPADWVEQSGASEMLAGVKKRGYYTNAYLDKPATINMEDGTEAYNRETAFHELGHRFEDKVPNITALEHEFYLRRTEGEALKWLGPGYKRDEVTRFDKFLSPYMGKDYGGRYHELLSMGLEGVYTGSQNMVKDEDYYDFILGVISAV